MESAKILVPFIASLDPLWADELDIMGKERGWDPLQIIGALCGYTLEQQAHMWIPQHPFFSDNHHPTGSDVECRQCKKIFKAPYPGAFICSNYCAEIYYPMAARPPETPQVKIDDSIKYPKAPKEKGDGKSWRKAQFTPEA